MSYKHNPSGWQQIVDRPLLTPSERAVKWCKLHQKAELARRKLVTDKLELLRLVSELRMKVVKLQEKLEEKKAA